jgi:hypothetical protein
MSEEYPLGGSLEPYDIERDKELIDETEQKKLFHEKEPISDQL